MKKFRLLSILAVSALLFACNNPDSPSTSSGGANSSTPTSQNTEGTSEVDTNLENKTIDELVATHPTDFNDAQEKFYIVEGVWDPTGDDDDQYGNGNLYNPTSGKSIVIYGMTKNKDTYVLGTNKSGFLQLTNPKNYQEVYGTTFNAGDKIKLGVQYNEFYDNYYSYFIEKVADASTFTYNITTAFDAEKGTVTLSATTGTYGTEITATVNAGAGYKIKSVKHNDTSLTSETAEYKFKVVPVNVVTVEFVDENEQTNYGTETAPISVAEALKIAEDECAKSTFLAHDVYVSGVFRVEVSGTNTNYFLDDSSATAGTSWIQLWNLSEMTYVKGVDTADPHDTIVVHGYLYNYKDEKFEFDKNGENPYEVIKNDRGTSKITLGTCEGADVTGIDANTTAKNGTEFTFTVVAQQNRAITSVKVNDTDAEPTGTDNQYKFTVHGDMNVVVTTRSIVTPPDSITVKTNAGTTNEIPDMLVGDTLELEVEVTPSDAVADVTWSSEQTNIADITVEDGKVTLTAKAAGTTKITATSTKVETVKKELTVNVFTGEKISLTSLKQNGTTDASAYKAYDNLKENNGEKSFAVSSGSTNSGIQLGINHMKNWLGTNISSISESIKTALSNDISTLEAAIKAEDDEKTPTADTSAHALVAASFEMKFDVSNVEKINYHIIQTWGKDADFATKAFILKSTDDGTTWSKVAEKEFETDLPAKSNVNFSYNETEIGDVRYAIAVLGAVKGNSTSTTGNGARLKFDEITIFYKNAA